MKRGQQRKTTKRLCQAMERQNKAIQLRMQGYTLDQIAKALKYSSPTGAAAAIKAALAKTLIEPAAEYRKMELRRMDGLFQKLWLVARRDGETIAIDSFMAIDRIMKIMERRAKLLGLDAPAKTQLTGADGGPLQVASAKPICILEPNGFEGPGAPRTKEDVEATIEAIKQKQPEAEATCQPNQPSAPK